MPEPQLSVRSAHARDLAHRLAVRERRTVAQIVEQALDLYARQTHGEETAIEFLSRLTREASADVDIEAVIRANRKPYSGIDL